MHTVFQSYALFPHMSVAANVSFPLEMLHTPRAEVRRRVAATLNRLEMLRDFDAGRRRALARMWTEIKVR